MGDNSTFYGMLLGSLEGFVGCYQAVFLEATACAETSKVVKHFSVFYFFIFYI